MYLSTTQNLCLLLWLTFSGNYYGTPRPVHIGPESPPITYQEHRNLLRNFRTRSKSLSNLEKAGEEDNSEEDTNNSGPPGSVSCSPPVGCGVARLFRVIFLLKLDSAWNKTVLNLLQNWTKLR